MLGLERERLGGRSAHLQARLRCFGGRSLRRRHCRDWVRAHHPGLVSRSSCASSSGNRVKEMGSAAGVQEIQI
jgi:hypothetical protein